MFDAAQKKFGVDLAPNESGYRIIFGLGPNEYLFNSEGFGLVAGTVRAFTVGELHEAIRRAPAKKADALVKPEKSSFR